eukprot:6080015-Pyramimonas_sp.AAC.1
MPTPLRSDSFSETPFLGTSSRRAARLAPLRRGGRSRVVVGAAARALEFHARKSDVCDLAVVLDLDDGLDIGGHAVVKVGWRVRVIELQRVRDH